MKINNKIQLNKSKSIFGMFKIRIDKKKQFLTDSDLEHSLYIVTVAYKFTYKACFQMSILRKNC